MSKNGFATVLLPIDKLVPMKFQSRISKEDPEKFKELVESIRENGIVEPVVARPLHDSEARYEIVAGTRRVRAAKEAGLHMVPVHVKEVSEDKAILLQLEENLHRDDYTDEDKTHALAELARLKGWKAQEIATNIHKSYNFVVKYLPSEFKDQKKAEAGSLGGMVKSATQRVAEQEQTVKTHDTLRNSSQPKPQETVECERCHTHVGKDNIKPWHNHNLCDKCFERAELNPETYDGYFRYVEKAKQGKIPDTLKPKEFKPEETWEQRKATMSPQHSKMELELLEMFSNDELLRPVQTERSFSLVSVTPDFVFPRLSLAVFLDGKEAHRNRQDRDEKLREQLEKYHHLKVLSITYDSNSEKEKQRIFKTVKDAV